MFKKINHKTFQFHGLLNIKIMLNEYSNITFPKVNYRVFSKKRHPKGVFSSVNLKNIFFFRKIQ
ncbi:hypothetical protein E0M28_14455 [Bacillus toyonensis]|nr:hypothetical protein E0M28_14455 [Bacillus toyonensis]